MIKMVRSTLLVGFAGESFAEISMIFQKTWFLKVLEVDFWNLTLFCWSDEYEGYFDSFIKFRIIFRIAFSAQIRKVSGCTKQLWGLGNLWDFTVEHFHFSYNDWMIKMVRSTLLDEFAGESFAEISMIFQKTWFLKVLEVDFWNLILFLLIRCVWNIFR